MKVKDLIKDVKNVELTPEQEKQIKDYLGIKDSKRFVPKGGDKYYWVMGDGYITDATYYPEHPVDRSRLAMGNYFETKVDAEFAVEKYKVYQELKRFADENNDPIDWSNPLQDKFYIMWDYENYSIRYTFSRWMKTLDAIYFSSKKLAMKAVEKVGEDRIKKYLFEVE